MLDSKKAEFIRLFQEFADTFAVTPEGQKHISLYDKNRQTGQQNFQSIQAAEARGEDVTDLVLLKLLPHMGTASNETQGAWNHHAPAITGNLKKWYESDGQSYDWQAITKAIFNFVQRCVTDPTELKNACLDFCNLTYSKGFQVGMLTPILNALRSDEFLLVNKKPCCVINYFEGTSYKAILTGYPQINAGLRQMIQAIALEMRQICPEVPLQDDDLFDMFCHWLVAVKKYNFDIRYWKIAPGENAWQWEECRDQGFIAIGWDELGDISTLDRKEFDMHRDQLIDQHPEQKWNKSGVNQVYTFAQIKPGDYIVANKGKTEVLGIGTVTGGYYFEPNASRYKHRLPIRWYDLTPKRVNQINWQRTLIALTLEQFEELDGNVVLPHLLPKATNLFTPATFALLTTWQDNPDLSFYYKHQDELRRHVQEPFNKLLHLIATRPSAQITTQAGATSWGTASLEGRFGFLGFLFIQITSTGLRFGFQVSSPYSQALDEYHQRFQQNCQKYQEILSWDLCGDPPNTIIPAELVLQSSDEQLSDRIVETFKKAFPSVLLATLDDPSQAIHEYISSLNDNPTILPITVAPKFTLTDCAEATQLDEALLQDWVKALDRKRQAVLYGPPGTGKTFLARHLAKHLIGGGNGFIDMVQFHPAYTYEDFIQGIRPKRTEGGLDYPIVPGRFLEFCEKAQLCGEHSCILIIDELNRANISQVFGELMYLLEYRDEKAYLASGETFSIPKNVRIIGTMNTADRSIALVDHALRRRFAFLYVPPNYEGLKKYHELRGYTATNLISLLKQINAQIGDPHYQIGTSFFLQENLSTEIRSIWQLEIEPYLEEFFFDQSDKMTTLRWEQVKGQLGL